MGHSPVWGGLREGGRRLARGKARLPKQVLALPHSEFDAEAVCDPHAQGLAAPALVIEAALLRTVPQRSSDHLHVLLAQPVRTAGPLDFA